ncbi:MAG TPA: MBL fold metallo-hydrolase [Candidatus Eisenbacteria bacterium]|uniref:MBL fold metallo-hydrolase n=1 Tax=Eiseniibacteriota bacterium TaxID=2212470 RepID=A0A7V2F3M3_UNCEI|nr:MBL fold metallo-hydrolase [Candidatus Eisenbacteria bacterium]
MRSLRWIAAATLAAVMMSGCSRQAETGGKGLVRLDGKVYAMIAAGPSSAEGLGANSGFIVGDESVLVIDSRFTDSHARQLLAAVRSVTDLPVRYLVNTHYHPDHVWGNSIFRAEGAIILARPETKIEMERFSPVYMEYYRQRKPDVFEMIKDVEPVLPDSLVGDELRLDLGGIEAAVSFLGPGHTAGDLVVSVPSKKIVFAGGLVSNGYHPNMGDQGADFDNWLLILDRIAESRPEIVVPGQGSAGDARMIDRQKSYIIDLTALTADAIRRGRQLSSSILEIKVPGTEGYLQGNLLPFNIQAIYRAKGFETVAPRIDIDVPAMLVVSDAAGGPDAGMVQWIAQSDDGYLELELSWQPTSRKEVILEDVYDRIARQAGSADGLYDFREEGSKRIIVGDETVPAVYGGWTYRKGTQMRGGGAWTWAMALIDGRIYSIRMMTNTADDKALEEQNIALLEETASTIRKK